MARNFLDSPWDAAIKVVDAHGASCSIGDLRSYNEQAQVGMTMPPPLALGNVGVFVDPAPSPAVDADLHMLADGALELLERDLDAEIEDPIAPGRSIPELDRLNAFVARGDRDQLLAYVDEQIARRTADLKFLRRLQDVYRLGIQNAVDSVQSTRISMLEDRTEPLTSGLVGAVIVTFVFTVLPVESIALESISWLAVVLGRVMSLPARRNRAALTAEIKAAKDSLAAIKDDIKKAKVALKPVSRSLEKRASKTSKSIKNKENNLAQIPEPETTIDLFRAKATDLANDETMVRVGKFLKDAAASHAGNKAADWEELPRELMPDADTTSEDQLQQLLSQGTEAPPAKRRLRIDIQLKETINAAFLELVALAEDALDTLKELRTFAETSSPSDDSTAALAQLMVQDSDKIQIGRQSLAQFQEKVAARPEALMKNLEDAFELAIWVLLYGSRVVRPVLAPQVGLPGYSHYVDLTDTQLSELLEALKDRFPDFADLSTDELAGQISALHQQLTAGPDKEASSENGRKESPAVLVHWKRFADAQQVFDAISDGFLVTTKQRAKASSHPTQ
jgi:hypothetical protein